MGLKGFSWQDRVTLSGYKMSIACEKGTATCPDREGPGTEEVSDASQGGTKHHHFLKCSFQYHRDIGHTPRFWGLLLCLAAVFLGIIIVFVVIVIVINYYYYFLLLDTRASSWQPEAELS